MADEFVMIVTTDLQDLRHRLHKAASILSDLHASQDYDRQRLKGKQEGVELAISYVDEILRSQLPNS